MKISRDAVRLAITVFVVAWGTNVSTPFLVLYKERLSLSDSATVGIFVVYVAGILGTLLVAGPLSDRLGRKPLVVPFTVLSALASLILLVGRDSLVVLLIGRFLLGVVSGAVLGVAAAWMLELLGDGKEQKAAVLTTVVTYFGFGFGPVSSSIYEQFFPHPLVVPFIIHAIATALVIPLLLKVPETHPPEPTAPLRVQLGVPPESRRAFITGVVPAAVWVFAFPSTAFALFPILLAESIDGSEVVLAGASGALTSWGAFAARPLVNRTGARRALPIGIITGAAGYLLGIVAFGTDWWVLLLPGAVALGAASGIISAGSLTVLGEISDDANRGKLTSTFYLLAYPGMAMPLLITTLGSVVGDFRAVSGVMLVLLAVTALCFVAAVVTSREAIEAPAGA